MLSAHLFAIIFRTPYMKIRLFQYCKACARSLGTWSWTSSLLLSSLLCTCVYPYTRMKVKVNSSKCAYPGARVDPFLAGLQTDRFSPIAPCVITCITSPYDGEVGRKFPRLLLLRIYFPSVRGRRCRRDFVTSHMMSWNCDDVRTWRRYRKNWPLRR